MCPLDVDLCVGPCASDSGRGVGNNSRPSVWVGPSRLGTDASFVVADPVCECSCCEGSEV